MKLAIASATVASLLTLGAFSPLALGQNLSPDALRPQVERAFQDQAAAARAKLQAQAAGPSSAVANAAAAALDRTTSAGIMAADPLLQLNAAYYNQSQELAKIAPKLPADLRAQVEREIQELQAKRQGLLKIRQRNMARQSTRPDLARRPAGHPAVGNAPRKTPPGQRLARPGANPQRNGIPTGKANPPRSELGSAWGPAGQRSNMRRQGPQQRRRPAAGDIPTARKPTAIPQ